MAQLWQLYDENGKPIPGKGAGKDEVYKGLLHAASHVWVWRRLNTGAEVLVQKRSANNTKWPNKYDISAAGHIDLGESPVEAAIRETKEEIGLEVTESKLKEIFTLKFHKEANNGIIENEFQWVYLLEIGEDKDFIIQDSVLDSILWMSLDDLRNEALSKETNFVPHGKEYFDKVISTITTQLG